MLVVIRSVPADDANDYDDDDDVSNRFPRSASSQRGVSATMASITVHNAQSGDVRYRSIINRKAVVSSARYFHFDCLRYTAHA